MKYKISIIVPVYNAEKYLDEAIDSVISQSLGFSSVQLLLCDDHSTDRSYEIAKKYQGKYSNVELLQTDENSGSASGPRNQCLSRVLAPFVMFLDNDDVLPRKACECLYKSIVNSDYDFVCGCYDELHYDKKHRAVDRYDSVEGNRAFLFPDDASDFRPIADPFWTKIFRTSIIQKNGLAFDSGVYGEDTIFMLRYLACSKKALHIKDIVYTYRIREDSLFHVVNKEHFVGVISGDKVIKSILTTSGYDSYWKEFITDHVSDFLDVIANSDISERDLSETISLWYEEIKEASQSGIPAKTPFGKIVFRDAARDDKESVIEDLMSLHRICIEKNRFVQDILNSKSWKIITRINQLFHR